MAAFKRFVDAGFTHVALVPVGESSQPAFPEWAGTDLVPRLKEL